MVYIRRLWKLFLYAGVEKEEYQQLLPMISEKNRELLKVFSLLSAIMFFLLFIASLLTSGFAVVNRTAFLLCGIGMLILLICSCLVPSEKTLVITLLVYLFEILLYVFGIHISLLHADKTAVSAVAFLLVGSMLFYDRPVRLSALTAAVVAVFCRIVSQYKAPDVAEADIWNMIAFGVAAIAITMFMMSIKIRTLIQSVQIENLSRTDLLTGLRNRNHYENRLEKYPGMCSSGLICVYADANGLHEINNREGHAAGDRMLCEVAAVLRKHFDPEHIYRVGGDEFVAFRADGQPDSLPSEIARIRQDLSSKGYHVSIGAAAREKAGGSLNVHALVGEAESNMFADKQEFYRRSENDRRSR